MAVTLRGDTQSGKGSPLTNQELDDNFKILGLEHGDTVADISIGGADIQATSTAFTAPALGLNTNAIFFDSSAFSVVSDNIPAYFLRRGSGSAAFWMTKDCQGDTSIGSTNTGQFFGVVGDSEERIICANFAKGQSVTWANGEIDSYTGEYTLTTYDKASGAGEQSVNVITSDSSRTAMRNKLVVWNNPTNSGDIQLSNLYLEYTGTEKDASSAVIGLRNNNANTNTSSLTLSEDKVKANLPFEAVHMTTTDRNALTASNGMVIYNTDNNRFEFYQNGGWVYYTATAA